MEAAIVQFPHPGGEHDARRKRPIFPWNTGAHQRKFMRGPGAYVDDTDRVREDELVFWGEWEAPSRVVRIWDSAPRLPTYLHEPHWESVVPEGFRQNTDPWVFGDRFRYSNCKQLSQRALRHLLPGSLVLFGSTLEDKFVLDTCFVASSSTAMPDTVGNIDQAFQVCTIDSLGNDAARFTVHFGAIPSDRVGGMYSFTPCLPVGSDALRFSRPTIELVRDQGLELGTFLRTPPRQG